MRTIAAAWLAVAIAGLMAVADPVAPAFAQNTLRGVALVIGNGEYEHLPPLANPAGDAQAVEDLFDGLGFDVTATTDRDARRLSRDLESFAEDAEGADVAVLYYAGHGIEAGGENFLVPVDADLSALDAAGEKLVPVSPLLAKLAAGVPVVIVMLDACRDSPFPPGATVRLAPGGVSLAVSAAGLGVPRSAAPLKDTTTSPDASHGGPNVGTVIAFAAEPGRPALDGAGSHSPYAAAILRHLSAMAGEEFGTVMRMVGEEVYLKTSGKQRPWVNESLRKLLYFGRATPAPSGDEGAILAERRQLLLTIAALPDPDRGQIERVAADAAVPMDALYGMLRTLGSEAPRDPIELERLLRGQTERLKDILAERATLTSPDAEIVRLSALADTALAEGALVAAASLHERAKARVAELEKTVDRAEADIRARRTEFAAVYARSAQAYELNFDYLKAADDYARAYAQIERWDDKLAWGYKQAETLSLRQQGVYNADNAALTRALDTGDAALKLAERMGDRSATRRTQQAIAFVLTTLGTRETGPATLQRAVALSRLAADAYDRKADPRAWAIARDNLGIALWTLGEYVDDKALIEESVGIYRAALDALTREKDPGDWASIQQDLGNALLSLGRLNNDPKWLFEASDAYLAALDATPRERDPLGWATLQYNLGHTYSPLAQLTTGYVSQKHAVEAYRAALGEFSRERMPMYWAQAQASLCVALGIMGDETGDLAALADGVAACRLALEVWRHDTLPVQWVTGQNSLAGALAALGRHETGTESLEQAVVAYRAVLEMWSRENLPLGWAWAHLDMGDVLVQIGRRDRAPARIEEGKAALQRAWDLYRELGFDYDAEFAKRIAAADEALAGMK